MINKTIKITNPNELSTNNCANKTRMNNNLFIKKNAFFNAMRNNVWENVNKIDRRFRKNNDQTKQKREKKTQRNDHIKKY